MSKPKTVRVDYNKEQLVGPRLVFTRLNTRSLEDRRVFIDRYVYSYTGGGMEFRKSFEVKKGCQPDVPPFGTSQEISAKQRQW